MYKQLYSITLAGLIGISAGAYGAEVAPKAPILVAFDQQLYKQYCENRQGAYENARDAKFMMLAVATVIIGIQTYALVTYPYAAKVTAAGTVAASWWKYSAYEKLATLAYAGIPAAVCALPGLAWKTFNLYSFTGLVKSALHNLTTLGDDMEAVNLWEERETIKDTEKQTLWHEEIYARFGRPEIVGDVPLTGKYKLKGYKANGVELIFDPFNREHVKALLGITLGESYWRFVKLEIIPVEDNKP